MVATPIIETDINQTCYDLFITEKQFLYDKLTAKYGRNRKAIHVDCFGEWHFAWVSTIWHKADSHVFSKACFNVYGRQMGAFMLTSVCFEVTNEFGFE